MKIKDWINIGLTTALVIFSFLLWKVNVRLADIQEFALESNAVAKLDMDVPWNCLKSEKLGKPGQVKASAKINLKNASVWPANNPRIEWIHWDGFGWLTKQPKGGPLLISGDPIQKGESLGLKIGSHTTPTPARKIKEENIHLIFIIRLEWDGPNNEPYEKVQYIDIHRLLSSESPLAEPYVACRVTNSLPKVDNITAPDF